MGVSPTDDRPPDVAVRAAELLDEQQQPAYRLTDRLFGGLLVAQWLASVFVALWVSPHTWAGLERQTHPHVWAALLLGAAVASLPVALGVARPGRASTRHAIAVGQ